MLWKGGDSCGKLWKVNPTTGGGGLNQDAAQKKRSKSYFYVEFGAESS